MGTGFVPVKISRPCSKRDLPWFSGSFPASWSLGWPGGGGDWGWVTKSDLSHVAGMSCLLFLCGEWVKS